MLRASIDRQTNTIDSQPRANTLHGPRSSHKKVYSNPKAPKTGNRAHKSQSLIKPESKANLEKHAQSKVSGLLRSKAFSVHLLKTAQGTKITSPYQKFVKELNIKLPSPKEKFHEFLDIPPFNRLHNHLEFISHILQKDIDFFRKHPVSLVNNIARKIVKLDPDNIPSNFMVILEEGTCYYNSKDNEGKTTSKPLSKGSLIVRRKFIASKFSYDCNEPLCLIGFHYHDYSSFISQYLDENLQRFKNFLAGIQIFKIFPEQAMQKIYASITLHFFMKGELLYMPGDEANCLYVVESGSVARKIIVELDKTNKIPLQGISKLVKVLSRSYEHRIQFQRQDLVGVAELIDNLPNRSENIIIDEDATLVAIDRNAIQEIMDEYIQDRLRKYNMRKYPRNYDQLCENYLKEKVESRRTEQRKIAALRDEFHLSNNEKKTEKISSIIKLYQDRIKQQNKEHLIEHKKLQRIVQSDA